MSQDAIIIDVALEAPPGLVWRALTEPALVARWLGANDVEARIGRRFTLEPTAGKPPVDCEVIEVEPDRLLSYRWRQSGEGGAAALDTVVTWVLDPAPDGGTRLRLVHDGFPITLYSAHTRESGEPGVFPPSAVGFRKNLDPRFRGDERTKRMPRVTSIEAQRSLAWAA